MSSTKTRTITIKLEEDLWRQAKIALIKRDSNFQEYLTSQLKKLIEKEGCN